MNDDSFTYGDLINQAIGHLGPRDREAAARPALAELLYVGACAVGAVGWRDLDEPTQQEWISKARLCQRLVTPIPWDVAIECGAEDMAHVQGWDWPTLEGWVPQEAADPSTPPAEVVRHLRRGRAEVRQKLRFLARVCGVAIRRHLEFGGRDSAEDEQRRLDDAGLMAWQDAATREATAPPSAFTAAPFRLFEVLRGGREPAPEGGDQ